MTAGSGDPHFPARRALITGASSGIGAATAKVLAGAGYRVALLARRREALDAVVAELPPCEAGPHLAVTADVCDEHAMRAAFATVDAAFGGLEVLVNNAGVGYRARVEELDVERVRSLFDTNVVGLLVACREALPLLRKGVRPVLVNVSSVVGRRGIPGQSVYAASKAAVCSISEALRLEWAEEDIVVCNLEPALTATGFFEAQANPAGLPGPDLSDADGPEQVGAEVLALVRDPVPERNLRWKWRLLAALSPIAPRLSDRLLARRLGGGWRAPRR